MTEDSQSELTLRELLLLSDADFIKNAYSILLGRDCDPQGTAFYHEQLASGVSRLNALSDLRRSNESQSVHRTLEIDRLLELHRRRNFPLLGWTSKSDFDREMRRAIDLPLLPAAGSKTLGDLFSLSDEEFIHKSYLLLLGREVDPQGKSHVIKQLARHGSRVRVLADLRRSRESQDTHRTLAFDPFLKVHGRRALPIVQWLAAANLQSATKRASLLPLPAIEPRHLGSDQSGETDQVDDLGSWSASHPSGPTAAPSPSDATPSFAEFEASVGARLSAIQLGMDVIRSEHEQYANGGAIVRAFESAFERIVADRLEEALARLADLESRTSAIQLGVDLVRREVNSSSVETRLDRFELYIGNLMSAQVELQGAVRTRVDDTLSLLRGAVRPEDVALVRDRLDSVVHAQREQVDFGHAILAEHQDLMGRLTRIERHASRQLLVLNDQVLVVTDDGVVVVPDDDPVLVVAIRHMNGVLEPGTVTVIRQLLNAGDTMIDVGAHIGLITLIASTKVGENGRIFAVEPVARSANALETMLHVNSLEDRVQLSRCAAGSASGEARINVGRILGHSSLLPLDTATGSAMVDVKPLDEIVPAGTSVKLVKLDVEGFELECLKGMTRLLSENPSIGIVAEFGPIHLERAGLSISDWFGAFAKLGFEGWEINEESGELSIPRPPRELARIHSINFLFWRGDKRVLTGLAKSGNG